MNGETLLGRYPSQFSNLVLLLWGLLVDVVVVVAVGGLSIE